MNITARPDPIVPLAANPLAGKIAEYEAELDQVWGPARVKGGWRKKEPFDKAPWKVLHRLKYLLKRRDRAVRGFDVEVDIIVPNKRNPLRCFAIARDPAPDVVAFDPSKPLASAWVPPDASSLAFEMMMPLERVEAALSRLPADFRSAEGVRAWCRLLDEGVKAAVAAGATVRAPESSVPAN